MGKAASEDQDVLGRLRKRRSHPDILCEHQLLFGRHRLPQDETRNVCLRRTPGHRNLADRYNTTHRPL